MTYATGKILSFTRKLDPTATSLFANIDVGVDAGRLYFKTDAQEEWIDYTGVTDNGTDYTYTGLTRGVSQVGDPATAGVGLTWLGGNSGALVAMHDQLADRKSDNTFSGNVTVVGDIISENISFSSTTEVGLKANNLTTTERLALTGANGMIVYDDTIGENWQYIAGVWAPFSSGSTQPNASETVAGKVEEGTQTEVDSGAITGSTGAKLFSNPLKLGRSIQKQAYKYATDTGAVNAYVVTLSPVPVAYVEGMKISFNPVNTNTGTSTINVNSLGVESLKRRDGTDLNSGDIVAGEILEFVYDGTNFQIHESNPATNTQKGIARFATDAEAEEQVLENVMVNPKQITELVIVSNTVTHLFSFTNVVQSNVVIAHGLGRIPRAIMFNTLRGIFDDFDELATSGYASYDGTTIIQKSLDGEDAVFRDSIAYFNNTSDQRRRWNITSIDDTNITLTNFVGSGTISEAVLFTVVQFIG